MSTSLHGTNLKKQNYNIKTILPNLILSMSLTQQFKGQTKNVFVDGVVVDLMVGERKILIDYAVHVKSAT